MKTDPTTDRFTLLTASDADLAQVIDERIAELFKPGRYCRNAKASDWLLLAAYVRRLVRQRERREASE